MDIATGVFTAMNSGYYIVTFGLTAFVEENEKTEIFIHHNGAEVAESEWASNGGSGWMQDQGSRTVVILDKFLPLNLKVLKVLKVLTLFESCKILQN